MSYQFKGFQWEELAECWGIKVEEKVIGMRKSLDEETTKVTEQGVLTQMEKIEVVHIINDMRMKFEVADHDEVLAEKVKRHIDDNCDNEGNFIDKQMRADLVAFLTALASDDDGIGYNAPVYRAIATVKNDWTMGQWVIRNLETLWS